MLGSDKDILGGMKPRDPLGVYFSPKALLALFVAVILLCLGFYLCGVYYGRKDAIEEMRAEWAKEQKSAMMANVGRVPSDKGQSPPPVPEVSTSSSSEGGASGNIPSGTTTPGGTTSSTTQQVGSIEGAKGGVQESNLSETSVTRGDGSVSPGEGSTTPVMHTLSPITPPLEEFTRGPEKSAEVVAGPKSEPVNTPPPNVDTSPKKGTYSIQLVSLSGADAEKRLQLLVERVNKKFGKKYQFTIERVGKFYRLSAVNFPDEQSARTALKELTQEKDFSNAMIKKPK